MRETGAAPPSGRVLAALPRGAAAFSVILGALALSGWIFDVGVLKSVLPGLPVMRPNAALCFMVAGLALWLRQAEDLSSGGDKVLSACAAVLCAVGVVSLGEYLFDLDLGVDWLLIARPAGASDLRALGRIPPTAAAAFILTGLAVRFAAPSRIKYTMAEAVAVAGLGLYAVVSAFAPAVHAGAGFLVLGLGLGAYLYTRAGLTPRSSAELLAQTGLLCAVAIAAVLFHLSWAGSRGLKERSVWVDRTWDIIRQVEVVENLAASQESASRGFALTGDEDFLAPSHRSDALLEPAINKVLSLTAFSGLHTADAQRLRAAVELKRAWTERVVRARRARGFAAARDLIATGEGERRMAVVRDALAAIRAGQEELLRSRRAGEEAASRTLVAIQIMGGVFSALLLAGAGFILVHEIDRSRRGEEEQALRARTLETILSSLGEGVVVADPDGKFTVWNAAAERLVGLGAKDVPPSQWTGVYGAMLPDQKTPYPAEELPLARALRGESCDEVEIFHRRGGEPQGRWLSISGRPLRDAAARPVGGVVVFRDVSMQRSAKEHLEALNASLERHAAEVTAVNNEMESFSYSVSHDLRAPLRAIDGFSAALLEDNAGQLDAQGREHLSRVRKAAQRMGQLIDDLLTLSRVTRASLSPESVDLSALAASVAADLSQRDPGRSVRFSVAAGIRAQGDPRLLRVVLENLLGNAWKYTGRTPEPAVEFGSALQSDGTTSYFVRDNGAGFDMAHAGKLFGAFQRLHADADFPGSGIGLATVSRIVLRHGGRVWPQGAVGKGATLYFTLGPAQAEIAGA